MVELATTHLKAKKPNHAIRTIQIQQLINHLKSEPNVILLGDFNADPQEDGISALKNSHYSKSIMEDQHFTSFKLRETEEKRQIDYIWLRSDNNEAKFDSALQSYDMSVFDVNRALPNEWMPSDHLPIFATVTFY